MLRCLRRDQMEPVSPLENAAADRSDSATRSGDAEPDHGWPSLPAASRLSLQQPKRGSGLRLDAPLASALRHLRGPGKPDPMNRGVQTEALAEALPGAFAPTRKAVPIRIGDGSPAPS